MLKAARCGYPKTMGRLGSILAVLWGIVAAGPAVSPPLWASEAAPRADSAFVPWTTAATGAQCGQECAYAKAKENLVIQAYYYTRLVDTMSERTQTADSVLQAAGGICNGVTGSDDDAKKANCIARVQVVAFASIQRARSSIHLNSARRDELNTEGSPVRMVDPSGYNSYEAGGTSHARGAMDPLVFSAAEINQLYETGRNHLGESVNRLGNPASMDRTAWAGAQADYATWLENVSQPQLTDYVAFRRDAATGRTFEITQAECSGAQRQWQNGICYDGAAFEAASIEFDRVHGTRASSSNPNDPRDGLGSSLRRLAQNIRNYSGRDLPGYVRSLRSQMAGATTAPTGLIERAYTQTRGAVGTAVNTELGSYTPPAPPRPVPSPRRVPGSRTPSLAPGGGGAVATETAPAAPGVGVAGIPAPSGTPNSGDSLYRAGAAADYQERLRASRREGDRRSIYLEMRDESLENLLLNVDNPGGGSSGQGFVHYGTGPAPAVVRTPNPDPVTGAAAPAPNRSTAGTPPPRRGGATTPSPASTSVPTSNDAYEATFGETTLTP